MYIITSINNIINMKNILKKSSHSIKSAAYIYLKIIINL